MSWWTNIRDWTEVAAVGPLAHGAWDRVGDQIGGAVNAITGRPSQDDIRNQKYAINDQIKAYKDQTALTQQEINTARNEQDVQKRKINEKQIRSLRNNFRPAGGFLNNQRQTLGNSSGLNNKLGS